MARYRWTGNPITLDIGGKLTAVKTGDEVSLSDDMARQMIAHNHGLEPLGGDGVQPTQTGVSDLYAAGLVDESGELVANKPKK